MVKKVGDKKGTKSKVKSTKKSGFIFEIKPSRNSIKSKEIKGLELPLLSIIKGSKKTSLKALYRGECIMNGNSVMYWKKLLGLDRCLESNLPNYVYEWYVNSDVLNYMYDHGSVRCKPDYSINSVGVEFSESITLLYNMLVEYSKVECGMSRINVDKYLGVCEWFILYLNRCVSSGCLSLLYTRDRSFNTTFKVNNKNYSYDIIIRLVEMLTKKGLVLNYIGNTMYGERPMSMMVINPDLISLLNVYNSDSVSFTTTPKNVVIVNSVTKGVTKKQNIIDIIDFSNLDDNLKQLVIEGEQILNNYHFFMNNKVDKTIDDFKLAEIWLQRILNITGDVCGRLFDDGSIQGKPKGVRAKIKLDKTETLSLDFKAIHPAILLYWEGIPMAEHDPYPKLPSIKVNQKKINRFVKYYGLDGNKYNPVRSIVKKLFLCLINADSVNKAVGSCYDELHKDQLKRGTRREQTMKYIGLPPLDLHKIATEIIAHNHMIAKYLGVGIGNKLQYMDSCIIMKCLDVLTRQEIPCIPIHDAIICRDYDKQVVIDTMTKAFIEVVGEGSGMNCIIEEE
jgi:hypothetical protein